MLLAVIGILVTGYLVIKQVKGNILWGILITWILGILCQFAGIYVPNPELGFYGLRHFSNGLSVPSIAPIFGKLDFSGIFSLNFVVVVFAFLFVDMFDTIGTLIGASSKAKMLDEEGKLPNIKGALMADAMATTLGAVMGTSTTTTFVESASGVSEGGRTGLDFCDDCCFIRSVPVFIPDFPGDSVLCNCAGAGSGRILYADKCDKY